MFVNQKHTIRKMPGKISGFEGTIRLTNILIGIIVWGCLLSGQLYGQASFSVQGSHCVGVELQFNDLSTGSIDSWSWDFGDGQTSPLQNPTHQYSLIGNYSVRLTINSGASVFTSDVIIFANPVADFTDSLLPYSSYSRVFKDNSQTNLPISSFTWNFNDGSSSLTLDTNQVVHKFRAAGDYSVRLQVVDENGCIDSVSHVITIQDLFKVPNVFTPNSDNLNDQFIVSTNGQNKFSIYVYNRWGNLVFRRKGVQQIVWDGHLPDGSLVKPGTYFYVITVEDSDATYEPETGFVSVFY